MGFKVAQSNSIYLVCLLEKKVLVESAGILDHALFA
jgi:hypothetical protein